MDDAPRATVGRSVDDVVDGGAEGHWARALALYMLASEASGVEEEFAYDTEECAVELVRLVRELREHLDKLSIDDDAGLTLNRQCRTCSGEGPPDCAECGGKGYVHADEADG